MLPNVAVVSGWCNKISMSVSVSVNLAVFGSPVTLSELYVRLIGKVR